MGDHYKMYFYLLTFTSPSNYRCFAYCILTLTKDGIF